MTLYTLLFVLATLGAPLARAERVEVAGSPCDSPLNVTLPPDPTYAIPSSQTQEANLFLALLSNASLPPFNSSQWFAGNLSAVVHELALVAQAYPQQTIDTLSAVRSTMLFGVEVNSTYLATLLGVYQQYQSAATPQLRQQIKATFKAQQEQWATRAQSQVATVLSAAPLWQLAGPAKRAFDHLLQLIQQCYEALPAQITSLKELIASLTKECGQPCQPTIDRLKRELAAAVDDLAYCQKTLDFSERLYGTTKLMTGSLWEHVYGILQAIAYDGKDAVQRLQQLDLDDVIFSLSLQLVVSEWHSVVVESFSMFYYACRNGFVPAVVMWE